MQAARDVCYTQDIWCIAQADTISLVATDQQNASGQIVKVMVTCYDM